MKTEADVVFLNEPRFTEHEADTEFNERRRRLAQEIKVFIAVHKLFRGKRVEVTFSHSGISSLVCILDTGEEKTVLKIPLKIGFSRNEAVFLEAWERVGVNVSHVIEVGEIGEHSYVLMEFIDAPTLRQKYTTEELIQHKTYVDMGSILRLMHTATAQGYGDLIDRKAEFPDIRTWLEHSQLRDKAPYIKEHEILHDVEHGSLERSYEIIFTKIGLSSETVYGHSDFAVGNIFATEPLTVFDPIPFLNHPYMDLGRSIVLAARAGSLVVTQHLIQGYFGDEKYDSQLLQAAIIVNAYMKLKYWHMTNRHEVIKNLKAHLAETQHLLGNS